MSNSQRVIHQTSSTEWDHHLKQGGLRNWASQPVARGFSTTCERETLEWTYECPTNKGINGCWITTIQVGTYQISE